jgi:uncharacterized protein
MRVAVTGSTGLIGTALTIRLTGEGHEVLRLVRREPAGPDQAHWDPRRGRIDADALATTDAVIHLAAKGIGTDLIWTRKVKRDILASRVDGTRLLAETMAKLAGGGSPAGRGPRVLVSASGSHYYGDGGDEVLTETSPTGRGFLAEVCRQWEGAAEPARAAGLRVAHLRTGVVQAGRGGTLPKQALLFRLGLGARLGWTGRQWFSWIALDDVVGAYRHILLDDGVDGPVNATAPNPVTNAEFTTTLAHVLGRPGFLRVPEPALRLVGGQLAEELLLFSQRLRPAVLQASGYAFRYPELQPALRHVLGRPPAA